MPRIPDPPDDEQDDEFERPVAVGGAGTPAGADADDAHEGPWFEGEQPADLGPEAALDQTTLDQATLSEPESIERPQDELYVGIACLALAASVFLPWYKSPFRTNISGWSSGTWGPFIFFLALAGVVIVALRRARVPIAFPYDHSLVLEGIGWLAVAMAFVKRFFLPSVGTVKFGINTIPMIVAMLAAVSVALLGGRVSSSAHLVMRPGWFKDKAGKTGALVVGGTIVLGAVFGLMIGPSNSVATPRPPIKTVKGFPDCAKKAGLPRPAGFTATGGQESTDKSLQQCSVSFTITASLATTAQRLERALRAANWKFTVNKTAASKATRYYLLTSPKCGQAFVFSQTAPATKTRKAITTSSVSVSLTPCPK